MSTDPIPFGVVDYVVIAVMLAISASTGIYHCIAGGGQKSTSKYLVADRSMGCIPLGMSYFVTFTSSIAVLGFPAEVFVYGIEYSLMILCYIWSYPLSAYLFTPVFRGLGFTSVYEYMGKRFNLGLRICCTILFILSNMVYMATTMLGPALAFEAVQGFEMWKTILITGVVCTFYCTLGGMKAVVWADVFQFVVMFGSILAVCILGSIEVGGLDYVWNIAKENGKLNFFEFDFQLTERISFFGLVFGFGLNSLAITTWQSAVQRVQAAKSLRHAQGSLLLNIPCMWIVYSITFFNGLVLYAFYNNQLTPLRPPTNSTFAPDTAMLLPGNEDSPRYEPNYSTADQILMFFVSSTFGKVPGLQGMLVACLLAGALSSVSSGLSAATACTLQDVIKPWRKWRAGKTNSVVMEDDAWDTKLSKMLNCGFGIMATLFGFLVPFLGSFMQISNILGGVFGGPMLGTFVLGMLLPRTNTWGAISGLLSGFAVGVFISGGSIVAEQLGTEPLTINKVSFLWYSTINLSVTVLVGVIVSEIVRCVKPSERKTVDPSLLVMQLRFKIPDIWYSYLHRPYYQAKYDEELKMSRVEMNTAIICNYSHTFSGKTD
ncbi:sodium-dependent multivitamin transporter-like [Glandiceps talaboti]